MTAAEYEVTNVVELDNGSRRHEFTVFSDGTNRIKGFAFPADPPARVVLEDRWDGLMSTPGGEFTELVLRLDQTLEEIEAGVLRRGFAPECGDFAVVDGRVRQVDALMNRSGLMEVIREWIVSRAEIVAR